MTEEERKQFNKMQEDLNELKQYVEQRKRQQLEFPLDQTSKTIIANL